MVAFTSRIATASCLSLGVLVGVQGQNITSDTHFYGQVPAVYPSRKSLSLSDMV